MGTVTKDEEMPAIGTRDYQMWMRGASAEAKLRTDELTDDNRELAHYVDACVGAGYTAATIVEHATVVFGPGLPWRVRCRMAWKLIRGYSDRRWYAGAEFARTEFGIGVRWERDDTGLHIWVTALALVVHLRRARR
jgi:hypothetical protein